MYPQTAEEFAALAEKGQTVIYQETDSLDVSPGPGWDLWGMRETPTERKAVWRKIVPVSEIVPW